MKPTAQRRRDRRALLDNLLDRMLRGTLSTAEAALAVEYIREEQRAYDQTRRSLGQTTAALTRNRSAADTAIREAEQRAERAEEHLAAYVDAFGPDAGDEFRAAEQRLAAQHDAHEDRRRAIADALGIDPDTIWPQLVEHARATRQRAEPQHTGGNAQDCPACPSTNPPFPFLCPATPVAA